MAIRMEDWMAANRDVYNAVVVEKTTSGPARFAPTGTTNADTDSWGDLCTQCHRPGWWNSGAGQTLCERHWDEY